MIDLCCISVLYLLCRLKTCWISNIIKNSLQRCFIFINLVLYKRITKSSGTTRIFLLGFDIMNMKRGLWILSWDALFWFWIILGFIIAGNFFRIISSAFPVSFLHEEVEAEVDWGCHKRCHREASESVSNSNILNHKTSNQTSHSLANTKVQCPHHSLNIYV